MKRAIGFLAVVLLAIMLLCMSSPGAAFARVQKMSIIPNTNTLLTSQETLNPITKSGILKIDETWSGNIFVANTVTVPMGVTLTIEPGTVVKFKYDRNYKTFDKAGLVIDGGTIQAAGTKDQMIWFTSAANDPINGDWLGITLRNTVTSEIRYAIVEFGEMGIMQFDSEVPVSNSIIRWNNAEGLYAERSKPTFENNRLYSNGYHEIALEQYNQAEISNNIFHDGVCAIHCEKTIAHIQGNYFNNYKWPAITAGMESTLEIIGNKFANIPYDPPYAIYGGSTATVAGNDFGDGSVPIPDLDFPEITNHVLGYLPGDPEDKYPYVYADKDETRKVKNKIGAGLGFGWALEYVDRSLYRFSLGSGEIGQSLDFIKIDPKSGEYVKCGNDVIINPRGLTYDGEFFFVNDFSLLKIFKFKLEANYVTIYDSFDIPEKEKGGTMGLTNDGHNLYLKSRDGSKLYKLDKSGNLLSEIYLENPIRFDSDIVWTGQYFWASGGCEKGIGRFTADGKLVGEIYPAAKDTWALAWDGKYLWTIQRTCEMWGDPKIYQIQIKDDSTN
jgi:hypothetical protein